jgi:hypothetical protein
MGDKIWETTNEHRKLAEFAIKQSAERNGVDIYSPELETFIDELIESKANQMALIQFLQNMLHKDLTDND